MSEHTEEIDYKVNKANWDPGPWMDEPDRVQWNHAGFACLIVRADSLGHLCGYVGVPEEHPLFGKDYNEAHEVADIYVHGGLTYAETCAGPICHVPEPGFPDKVWWLGFDCAHLGDTSPGMSVLSKRLYPSKDYKTVEWVRAETERLAEQLAEIAAPTATASRETAIN